LFYIRILFYIFYTLTPLILYGNNDFVKWKKLKDLYFKIVKNIKFLLHYNKMLKNIFGYVLI